MLSVRETVLSDRVACFTHVSFQHLNENKAGGLVTQLLNTVGKHHATFHSLLD